MVVGGLKVILFCLSVQQLRRELESLKAEADQLRRNGVEAVEAYQRKKQRADELLETLVALRQEYDDLHASKQEAEQQAAEMRLALLEKEEEVDMLRRAQVPEVRRGGLLVLGK